MKKTTFFIIGLLIMLSSYGQHEFDAITHDIPAGTWVIPNGYETVEFINEDIGWIASCSYNAYDHVYKTTNGGTSWTQVIIDASTPRFYNDIQFIDANTGFALSSSGYIYKTTDGGANWSQGEYVSSWTGTEGYNVSGKVQFLDANTGYGCREDRAVLKIGDWGDNSKWTYTNGAYSCQDMHFADANNGWVVRDESSGSNSYYTSDGGTNWTSLDINSSGADFKSVFMTDASTIYATESYSKIYKSTDGGSNWNILTQTGNGWLYGIDFSSSGFGVAVGQEPIALTIEDAGATITAATVTGTTETLKDVSVVNSNFIAAVGNSETLVISSGDGGDEGSTVKEILINDNICYPNPAKNQININLETYDEDVSVTIYDIDGKLCHKTTLGQKHTIISTNDFAKGLYIVKISNGKGLFIGSQKLVIE